MGYPQVLPSLVVSLPLVEATVLPHHNQADMLLTPTKDLRHLLHVHELLIDGPEISQRTLHPDVHNVRSVRGARGGFRRALQLGQVNTPLSAERYVHIVLFHDGKDNLCRRSKFGICRGFGDQETV
jgi:hypothetical protein